MNTGGSCTLERAVHSILGHLLREDLWGGIDRGKFGTSLRTPKEASNLWVVRSENLSCIDAESIESIDEGVVLKPLAEVNIFNTSLIFQNAFTNF
jgi:hypothetical protein